MSTWGVWVYVFYGGGASFEEACADKGDNVFIG